MEQEGARHAIADFVTEVRPYFVRYLAAWTPLVAAYVIVFLFTTTSPFGWALLTAVANIAGPVVLGGPVFFIVSRYLLRAAAIVKLASHMALSLVFSLVWYGLLMVELSFIGGLRDGDFAPVSFAGPALTWQLFQGLVLYFLIVAGAYVIVLQVRGSYLISGLVTPPSAPDKAPQVVEAEPGLSRVFVKGPEGYLPLDFADIVSINGADDYCEVKTPVSTHLIRMTLASFEERLDPGAFVRVHRSHIVALARIQRVEPRPGGGLKLHMVGGGLVLASRAGAAALQPFLVT